MSTMNDQKDTVDGILSIADKEEQAAKLNGLIQAANQPDIIITLHYKPYTRQLFFGATAIGLPYDQLIQLFTEGIKEASRLNAESIKDDKTQ